MPDVRKIGVPLDGKERSALTLLAERELRDPRDQARVFIRRALESYGLLERDEGEPGKEVGTGEQAAAEGPEPGEQIPAGGGVR